MSSISSMIWEQTLEDLRGKLDQESYQTWIEPVQMLRQEGNCVTLGVPSVFIRNWLANNFHDHITESLSAFAQAEIDVLYEVQEDHAAPGAGAPANGGGQPASASSLLSQGFQRVGRTDRPTELVTVPLNRNYTFDNFVVGESNQFAHAAAQAVADPQSRVYNPLFIYGGVGLGKTHLMQAIGQQLLSYGDHFNVLYVSSEAFMNAFIDAVAQKKMMEFRNCFRNVDLLMVDDVQFFAGAEQTQTEFFHTFNVLYDAGKKIVLSSDHPPKELHQLEERLRSRFEWGLIVDIQPPDLETRVAILRRKAAKAGLSLPAEVTIFIAERIRTNLRKLEGSLTRLAAHSAISGEPITLDMARSLLGPFLVGTEPRKITVEKVQATLCQFFNISMAEMVGGNRSRKFAQPRQIAQYLCRELTDCSFPEIARLFGGRDHSSIIHAHRKIKIDMAKDMNLQNLVKHLTRLIKEEKPVQDGSH